MSDQPAGHYYAQGDPPGTVRYWDGTQWVGEPIPAPPTSATPPPPPGSPTGTESGAFASIGVRLGAAIVDGIIGVLIVGMEGKAQTASRLVRYAIPVGDDLDSVRDLIFFGDAWA